MINETEVSKYSRRLGIRQAMSHVMHVHTEFQRLHILLPTSNNGLVPFINNNDHGLECMAEMLFALRDELNSIDNLRPILKGDKENANSD